MTGNDRLGGAVPQASDLLERAGTVLLVDWPSRDVPEALAAAGFSVIVKGGPAPEDYTAWQAGDSGISAQPLGRRPDHADIVYVYRPLGELPAIITMAAELGARAIWRQSGLTPAGDKAPDGCWLPPTESEHGREMAAAAGLGYIDDTYIVDAARSLGRRGQPGQ